uniref:DNA (cytosine-5-)-methyltransferase n=1 Tax=Macrostomum lignano TaxID=282301 RepID=A0A1I8GWX0_9PLAT
MVACCRMGPIDEWWLSGFDGGQRAIVGFSTVYGEYILAKPHSEYSRKEEAVEYEELLELVAPISADAVQSHASFLIEQVRAMDDEEGTELMRQPCMQTLVELGGLNEDADSEEADQENVDRPTGRRDRRSRAPERRPQPRRHRRIVQAKPQQAAQSADTKATVTPLVRSVFDSIFQHQLDDDAGAADFVTSTKADMFLRLARLNAAALVQAGDPVEFLGEPIQRRPPSVAAGRRLRLYYSAVRLGSRCRLSIGDFVLWRSSWRDARPGSWRAARITRLYSEGSGPQLQARFHGSAFLHGEDTILGRTADPCELFATNDECCSAELAAVVMRLEVARRSAGDRLVTASAAEMEANASAGRLFYQKVYLPDKGFFIDPPNDQAEEEPADPDADADGNQDDEDSYRDCSTCSARRRSCLEAVPRPCRALTAAASAASTAGANKQRYSAFRWRGQVYKLLGCCYLEPGSHKFANESTRRASQQQQQQPAKADKDSPYPDSVYTERYRKTAYVKGSNESTPAPYQVSCFVFSLAFTTIFTITDFFTITNILTFNTHSLISSHSLISPHSPISSHSTISSHSPISSHSLILHSPISHSINSHLPITFTNLLAFTNLSTLTNLLAFTNLSTLTNLLAFTILSTFTNLLAFTNLSTFTNLLAFTILSTFTNLLAFTILSTFTNLLAFTILSTFTNLLAFTILSTFTNLLAFTILSTFTNLLAFTILSTFTNLLAFTILSTFTNLLAFTNVSTLTNLLAFTILSTFTNLLAFTNLSTFTNLLHSPSHQSACHHSLHIHQSACIHHSLHIYQSLRIGRIVEIFKRGPSFPLRIRLKMFYRPEDAVATLDSDRLRPLHLLYCSDEECSVVVSERVRGLCTVVHADELEGLYTSPEQFFLSGPDRFYYDTQFDADTGQMESVCVEQESVDLQAMRDEAAQLAQVKPLRCLDVFSGCGGLSEGLHQAGAAVTHWAIERDPDAAKAFALNHPDCAVLTDDCNRLLRLAMDGVSETPDSRRLPIPQRGQVQLLCGGPPCQGYSGMNRFSAREASKLKNSLVASFLSYADFYRPDYFLLENVRNFAAYNKSCVLQLTMRCLLAMGYQL